LSAVKRRCGCHVAARRSPWATPTKTPVVILCQIENEKARHLGRRAISQGVAEVTEEPNHAENRTDSRLHPRFRPRAGQEVLRGENWTEAQRGIRRRCHL